MELACESCLAFTLSQVAPHAMSRAEQDHQGIEVIFKPPFRSCDHLFRFLCFRQSPALVV